MAVSQPELDFPRKGEADLFGAEALYDGDLFAAAPPAATVATGTAAAVITISASASGNVRVAGDASATVAVESASTGALAAPATARPSLTGDITLYIKTHQSMQVLCPAASGGTEATGYEWSKDGGTTWGPGTTSHAFSGLTPSATYVIQVRAKDADGNVSTPPLSLTVVMEATEDTVSPVMPNGLLQILDIGPNHATVYCPVEATDDRGTVFYEWSRDGFATYVRDGRTHTFYGLAPNTQYGFMVCAADLGGYWSDRTIVKWVTTPADAPTGVTGAAAAVIAVSSAGAGVVAVRGTESATVSVASTASGQSAVAGSGSVSVAVASAGTGEVSAGPISGTASAGVAVASSATGKAVVAGQSAATVSVASASTGTAIMPGITGAASATVLVGSLSAGAAEVRGQGGAVIGVASVSAGRVFSGIQGAAQAVIGVVGSGAGTAAVRGAGTAPVSVASTGIIDVTARLSGSAVITVGSASTGATRVAGEGSAPVEISSQSAAAAWVQGAVAGLVGIDSIGIGRVGQRKVDGDVSVVTLLREISACPPRLEAVARSSHVQVCASTGSRAIWRHRA